MSETVLESVLNVLYSGKGRNRFNTNLCPRSLKHTPRGQDNLRSHKDSVSGSRSKCISLRSTKSSSPSRSSEKILSTDYGEKRISRSRDSQRSRSQRSATRSKSELRPDRSRSSRSSSLSRVKDRGQTDPETQTILDTLPLPEKYLQQSHVPSTCHGDVPTSQKSYVPTSQKSYVPTSQHGDVFTSQMSYVPTSQHGDVSTSQKSYVSTSQYAYVPTSQHSDVSSAWHVDVSRKVLRTDEEGETDSGCSSVNMSDRSSSYYRDWSNLDELFKGGRSSRGDTIPTAHVSPHQTSHTSSYGHHPPHRAASPTAPLRRTVSTSDFAHLYFRSVSPSADDGYLLHKAAYGEAVGARRWNSYQNLQQERTPLCGLADRVPGLVKAGCDSSRVCSQSHLNLTTGCDGSPSAALRTASSVQHVGYTAADTDLYLHHLGTGGSTQDLKGCMSAPLSPYSSDHTRGHTSYAGSTKLGSEYGAGYTVPVQQHPGAAGGVVPQYRHEAWTRADSSDVSTWQQQTRADSSDVSTWQQQHEQHLRRQHMEATKGLTNGTTSSAGLTSLLDPHKLDAVKRAADSIIREKDAIIDKQKLKICDLEQRNQERESDKYKVMLHQAQEENGALHFKLQEVEYECASLKAKLTEVTSSKGVADMERHLRKSEHQLKELRDSANTDRQSRLVEQKSVQDMLAAKDAALREWQEKHAVQTARLEALQHGAGGSTHLSTPDTKRLNELRQLREDKARYKARSLELERRLEAAKNSYRQRQEQVQHLEQSNDLLQQQVQQLQTETAELRTDLGLGEDGEHALFVLREEVEDLRHDNRRLNADLDKARKLLDAKHKKQQALEAQHQGDTKTLEDRLTHGEGTVTELRQELSNKEQLLKKLRASIKELNSEKADLSEKNSCLQEVQKELERQLTGEAHKLEQRLLREMSVCFTELQSLVHICVQRAEGQDPNISVLLGVKGIMSLDPEDMQPVGDSVQSLKYKVSKVHTLRRDIDNLRELICNKYAEDMSENLECTTQ